MRERGRGKSVRVERFVGRESPHPYLASHPSMCVEYSTHKK